MLEEVSEKSLNKFESAHAFSRRWLELRDECQHKDGGYSHFGISINFLVAFSCSKENYKWLCDSGFHPIPITRSTIRNMTYDQARGVLMRNYWYPLALDEIPMQIACILYDTALMYDKNVAVRLIQRAFNRCVLYGYKLVISGTMDNDTKHALRVTNTKALWECALDESMKYALSIAQNYPKYHEMSETWIDRINALGVFVRNL